MTTEDSKMLNELLALDEGLTDWEVGFIESLDAARGMGFTFTERQRVKLRQVWNDRLGPRTGKLKHDDGD